MAPSNLFFKPRKIALLASPIGLRVFNRGEVMLDAEVLHELSKPLISELDPIISDDGLGDVKPDQKILLKELDACLCGDFSEWFGEVVY